MICTGGPHPSKDNVDVVTLLIRNHVTALSSKLTLIMAQQTVFLVLVDKMASP